MKRKTINPFKMRWSYIGAIIALIYLPIGLKYHLPDLYDLVNLIRIYLIPNLPLLNPFLVSIVFGFLVGWLVELIMRKK